jgi:hypothetical protein
MFYGVNNNQQTSALLITRAVKAANYDFNARLFHHKTVRSDDARGCAKINTKTRK